jgi:prophage regulatory protein
MRDTTGRHREWEGTLSERILRTKEVVERVGKGRTTIWREEREGRFPKRRVIGEGQVGWLESEITEWIRSRPLASPEP